jgi:hypothetical protein
MNWQHETWRKLYVREEGSFASLSWTARALGGNLLKYCDRQGRIFPAAGEDIRDSICFRIGANRGERRLVRPAIDELLKDGYLVAGERGSVRIRNFARGQGLGEPSTNEPPIDHEPATNRERTDNEAATNRTRTCNEGRVNSARSLRSPSVVPSVPFRSVPAVPSEETNPPRGTEGAGALLQLFSRIRRQVKPDCFDWNPTGQGVWQAAEQTSDFLDAHPEAHEHVAETMRRVLKAAKDKHDTNGPNVLFGRWAANFTHLCEQLKGVAADPTAAAPCAFHAGGANTGRLPRKDLVSLACPECKHVQARASPRPASEPSSAGDLFAGR